MDKDFDTPGEALAHLNLQRIRYSSQLKSSFRTPSDALAHYGVKGMKWGVRKDDRGGGNAGSVSTGLAILAVYGGITVHKAAYEYKDSGRKEANRITRIEKKTGVKKEWPTKDSLAGPKTQAEIEKTVIPDINRGNPDVPGTSMNCRRCTFAYEMRRRGMDVAATKSMRATGQDQAGVLQAITPNSTARSIRSHSASNKKWGENDIPSRVNGKAMDQTQKSKAIFDTLAKQPNGSRGELAFGWSFGGGHSVAYEIIKNKPVVFCTQTGKSFSTPSAFEKDGYGGVLTGAAFTRLDNADLNNDFLKRWVTDA